VHSGYEQDQKLNTNQIYHLLHDTLALPNFTGEENWTSSFRSRAGFSPFGREVSDFTYKDTEEALSRHFLAMQHQYAVHGSSQRATMAMRLCIA
jgi:hypothetical protein